MAKKSQPAQLSVELISNIRDEVAADNRSLDDAIAALEKYAGKVKVAGADVGTVGKAGFGAVAKALNKGLAGVKQEKAIAEKAFLEKFGAAGAQALATRSKQVGEQAALEREAARQSAVAQIRADQDAARQAAAAQAAQAATEKAARDQYLKDGAAAVATYKSLGKEESTAARLVATAKSQAAREAAQAAVAAAKATAEAAGAGDRKAAEAARDLVRAKLEEATALEQAHQKMLFGSGSLEAYTGGLTGTLGPMGGLIERGVKIGKALGTGGALGATIALTGGVLALGVATIGVAVSIGALAAKLVSMSVAGTDAARSLRLTQDATWGSAEAGDAMRQSVLNAVDSLGVTKDAAFQAADAVRELGVKGRGAETAMQALAIAQTTGSAEAVEQVKKQIASAKALGRGYDAVLVKAQRVYGPIALAQAKSLTHQFAKVKAGAQSIVSGVKLDPFLAGLEKVTDVFAEGSSAVKALGAMVNALLDPLLGGSESAGASIASMCKTGIIWLAKVELAVLRASNAMLRIVPDGAVANVDLVTTSLGLLGVALAPVVAGVAATGIAIAAIGVGFGVFVAGVATVAAGISALVGRFTAAKQAISEMGWQGLGAEIVQGLVMGIAGGLSGVVAAVAGIAKAAKATFASALGIKSPSTVFASYALQMGRGLEVGAKRAEPAAAEATRSLAVAATPDQPALSSPARVNQTTPTLPAAPAPVVRQAQRASTGAATAKIVVELRGETSSPQAGSIKDFLDDLASALEQVGVEMAVAP